MFKIYIYIYIYTYVYTGEKHRLVVGKSCPACFRASDIRVSASSCYNDTTTSIPNYAPFPNLSPPSLSLLISSNDTVGKYSRAKE